MAENDSEVETSETEEQEEIRLDPTVNRRKLERYQRSAPLEVQSRVSLYVVRGLFFMAVAGIGYHASRQLEAHWFYGMVVACALGFAVIVGEIFFSKAPIRILSALAIGLTMGWVLSLVFQPVVVFIVGTVSPDLLTANGEIQPPLDEIFRLITTTIFCYFGVTVLIQTKDDFKFIIPYIEFRKDVRGHTPLVLDTSAIIDGRVVPLLETRVVDQRLVIPRFVLNELQDIADSADRSKRERGRRGLDAVEQLQRRYDFEILEQDTRPGSDVDRELLRTVEELRGKLITSDFNLQRRAAVQNIPVVNINDLAAALKPVVVPGESLSVKLLREGEDPGQAVGFLDDGTMVVVENASRQVGRDVSVEVTSATQTNVGKMIFGKLKRNRLPRDRRRPNRSGEPS